PAFMSTPHASSASTVFIRLSNSSGTLGRPSGKRSPFHSRVNSRRCSVVNIPSCAPPHTLNPNITTANTSKEKFFFMFSAPQLNEQSIAGNPALRSAVVQFVARASRPLWRERPAPALEFLHACSDQGARDTLNQVKTANMFAILIEVAE